MSEIKQERIQGRIGKRRKRLFKILAGILPVVLFFAIWTHSAEKDAHFTPIDPKEDLAIFLRDITKDAVEPWEYEVLYRQTGLGKPAVDRLLCYSGYEKRILAFQEQFFAPVKYKCSKNSIISREERMIDEEGTTAEVMLAQVETGDILLTKCSHTYGWRNGHGAIVINAVTGKTLESVVLGQDSLVQSLSKWEKYPNLIILRLKDASKEKRSEIGRMAKELLTGVPYDFTVGVLSKKEQPKDRITGTQCAHLIWQAYTMGGYDLDSDGGRIVTPRDILYSNHLEIIQMYGMNPENLWE